MENGHMMRSDHRCQLGDEPMVRTTSTLRWPEKIDN